jgi:hypothetical protein
MRREHLAWRLSRPKENPKQKERRAHTHSCTCCADLACSARCWSRHLILPTCTRRLPANSAGRQGALAAQKRIRSKKERRESRRVHHVTEMLAPLGLVFGLSFFLSQWHMPRRRRRGGARSLLRVRELPRCCACMLELWRCVLALQRLSNSARERAAALRAPRHPPCSDGGARAGFWPKKGVAIAHTRAILWTKISGRTLLFCEVSPRATAIAGAITSRWAFCLLDPATAKPSIIRLEPARCARRGYMEEGPLC